MSKEMQLLRSKLEFCKSLINLYDNLNFIDKSNKYNKKLLYSFLTLELILF